MSMAQPSVASGRLHTAVCKQINPRRTFRLVVRYGTRVFMCWTSVWSQFLLGLLGSFTSLALVWRGVIWVVGGRRRSVLLRIGLGLRGAGCTAAGTWRAGAGMGFWSLWGVRTSRLRFAVFALSLGRLRRRWLGTRACRRRRWLRARKVLGGISLSAMW